MSIPQMSEMPSAGSLMRRQAFILTLFSATLFVSALMLFGVQPLFAKMVLPKLGGSPAVWSVALVFFQGVLLLGYAYAHALTRWFRPRTGALVHLIILTLAVTSMPIAYPAGWQEPPQSGLVFWVLGLFAVGVGIPFFAVAANAPLLQSWFFRTGHPHGTDPYFLYGASNIGSFCALFLYPFLLEPTMALRSQSILWSAGYAVLAGMVVLCCGILWKMVRAEQAAVPVAVDAETVTEAAPSWSDRGAWIGLSMVPSGLLVGVTVHITTDLVSAPFLWVVPLALFLLTFVLTFQRNPVLPHELVLKLHSFLIAPLIIMIFSGAVELYMVPLHLGVFFMSAMVCHGELVRRRPPARHLTEFYLWMSFGGLLGGVFASLIAPHVFNQVLEYPILILAVFFCRPDTLQAARNADFRAMLPFVLAITLVLAHFAEITRQAVYFVLFPGLAIAVLATALLRNRPFQQAGMVATGIVLVMGFTLHHDVVTRARSFFGVVAVLADEDGRFHMMKHGSTLHGSEERFTEDGTSVTGKPEPLTYYYEGGPLEVAVDMIRQAKRGLDNVAIVGLGTGAMACHRRNNETWRYFEIDSEVVRLARDPRYFRFLNECGESAGIVVGDGRIMLGKEPDTVFDVIVLDAFSSDSIPVHLLTTEALALYFSKLKPGGSLVFHISNRYMELASTVSATARTHGAATYINVGIEKRWGADREAQKFMALVAVVSKARQSLEMFEADPRWFSLKQAEHSTPWSDDYSNILGAMVRAKVRGVVPDHTR